MYLHFFWSLACNLPADPGPCEAAFGRYYFNKADGHCDMFSYGGCEGNGNNYESLEECQRVCPTIHEHTSMFLKCFKQENI